MTASLKIFSLTRLYDLLKHVYEEADRRVTSVSYIMVEASSHKKPILEASNCSLLKKIKHPN
jgi:hypothetical protein